MKADAYEISKVFGFDRQLSAPLFQRPYVWEQERQWKPLWEDTKTIAEHLLADEENLRPHFLGAIVLEQLRVPVGKPDARSIIDGQQRLTTIQILLKAIRDICMIDSKFPRLGESIELLMFNHSAMIDEADDRYKVWPTNIDQDAYRIVMKAQSPKDVISELEKNVGAEKSNIEDNDLVFSQFDGRPMLPDTVTHVWTKLTKRLGLTGLRFHDIRHTHASLMPKQGIHPKIVQERLGHASIKITLDTYSHVAPGLQEAAAMRFDEMLKPKAKKEPIEIDY